MYLHSITYNQIRAIKQVLFQILLLSGLLLLSGCGGGSSDSGGGSSFTRSAPPTTRGILIPDVPNTITQSGTYIITNVPWMTDIRIDCSSANVNVTANSPLEISFATNCINGFATIFDYPAGGGTLVVNFNSGIQILVSIVEALSIGGGR